MHTQTNKLMRHFSWNNEISLAPNTETSLRLDAWQASISPLRVPPTLSLPPLFFSLYAGALAHSAACRLPSVKGRDEHRSPSRGHPGPLQSRWEGQKAEYRRAEATFDHCLTLSDIRRRETVRTCGYLAVLLQM